MFEKTAEEHACGADRLGDLPPELYAGATFGELVTVHRIRGPLRCPGTRGEVASAFADMAVRCKSLGVTESPRRAPADDTGGRPFRSQRAAARSVSARRPSHRAPSRHRRGSARAPRPVFRRFATPRAAPFRR